MNASIPQVTVTCIDFAQTPLAGHYSAFYAKVIDGLFTPTDCSRLLGIASQGDGWKPAGLSTGEGPQTVHVDFRNSDRVLVIDDVHAAWIYGKLRPYVEELYEIAPEGRWGCITGRPGKKLGPTWSLSGVNPRLSFLRYGPGHYFKPHCDGLSEVGAAKSFVTLHLYLNDSAATSMPLHPEILPASQPPYTTPLPTPLPVQYSVGVEAVAVEPQQHAPHAGADDDVLLQGGATRFWAADKKAHLDVHPKLGRLLIFQQRMLVHSGEEVTQGVKYTMRSDFLFTQG